MPTQLSVNVNKLATLRNARGGNLPDVVKMTKQIAKWGANGITIHPRPDERHIRRSDAFEISSALQELGPQLPHQFEFNIEGYPSEDFLNLIFQIRPDQCTLVPDPPDTLTSNAGWLLNKNKSFLQRVCQRLHQEGVRSSLFVDPLSWNSKETEALKEISPSRVELYTESFATDFENNQLPQGLQPYISLAQRASELNIGLNAGHDLNQKNLPQLLQAIPSLEEVSIGHALICEALYDGIETTIRNYLKILRGQAS